MTLLTNKQRTHFLYTGFGIVVAGILLVLGRSLNPFMPQFFDGGHDETQAPRVLQFTDNLLHGHIPPRMAPQFSFSFGYPVFNFYAPAAYWITGMLNLIFPDVIVALKLSYLLAILSSFVFTFLFLTKHFSKSSAVIGASLYAASIYMAIDIFIRTNLAETWFLAFVPLSLWLLTLNAPSRNRWLFTATTIALSLSLTTHNILSPMWGLVLIVYCLLLEKKRRNFTALFIAILTASYFYLPLLSESGLTYLSTIAKQTDYRAHFLCPAQLWQSAWGFGGSNPGCTDDGMSFMVGKPQLIFALLGIITGSWFFAVNTKQRTRHFSYWIFFTALTLGSLFLTTQLSAFVWNLFPHIMPMIQFPWRFIAFSMVGLAFLAASFWNSIHMPFKNVAAVVLIAAVLRVDGKYFTRPSIPAADYMKTYVSTEHIQTESAYKIPEYLPRSADYAVWKSYDMADNTGRLLPTSSYQQPVILASGQNGTVIQNDGYIKMVSVHAPQQITLNILYFPYWRILVNDAEIIPTVFDQLGRPVLTLNQPAQVKMVYRQTAVEALGTVISALTLIGLCCFAIYPAAAALFQKSRFTRGR